MDKKTEQNDCPTCKGSGYKYNGFHMVPKSPCPDCTSQEPDHIVQVNVIITKAKEKYTCLNCGHLAPAKIGDMRTCICGYAWRDHIVERNKKVETSEFTRKNRLRIERDKILLNNTALKNISKTTLRVIAIEAIEHLRKACDIIQELEEDVKQFNKGWEAAQNGESEGERVDCELQGWRIFNYERLEAKLKELNQQ